MEMKTSNRIISFILALLLMLGTVYIPSPTYAIENGSDGIDYEIKEVDGVSYQVYRFNDVFKNEPKLQLFSRALRNAPVNGVDIEQYYVVVNWSTYNLAADDLGTPAYLEIRDLYDDQSRTLAKTDPITGMPKGVKYYFKATDIWRDTSSDISRDPDDWYLYAPANIQLELRLKYGREGSFSDNNVEANFAQKGLSIYKFEYFVNNKITNIEAQRIITDNKPVSIELNTENLNQNEYYSFATKLGVSNPIYNGEEINVLKYGNADPNKLVVSHSTANRIKIQVKVPGATSYDRGPGTFEENNIKYHYEVTGDYNTPHIATFREELKVNFDPNGGTWKNVETGKEKEAKSYTIGHSMKLADKWADLGPVDIPQAKSLTLPKAADGTDKKLLGWNRDKKAKAGEDLSELVINEDTTFYAIYEEQGKGYVNIKYLDLENKDISANKINGESYPTEAEGDINTLVNADSFKEINAPKFKGYEISRVDIDNQAKYTKEKTYNVTYRYKKSEEKLGKVKVIYIDENNQEIDAKYHIDGEKYPDEKYGKLNTLVKRTDFSEKKPEFEGYIFSSIFFNTKGTYYTETGRDTVKYKYYKKVTTDEPKNKNVYFPVIFDANEGKFESDPKDKKTVYVYFDGNDATVEKVIFKEVKDEFEKAYKNPTKDGFAFNEWQDKADKGSAVADNYEIKFQGWDWEGDPDNGYVPETFYAAYAKAGALISYVDLDGKTIADKFKIDTEKYPEEKAGNDGEAIDKNVYTADNAPKFAGYIFNRIELNPANAKYAMDNKPTIKIYYEKLDDIIPDDTPDDDTDKPESYVSVKFLPGTNGTLEGTTKFYVNPKAGKKNSDLTEPIIKANVGYKVKDAKWDPAFVAETEIKADATYTAQYDKLDDVITGDKEKPDGYVTVRFLTNKNGTLEGQTTFYVNPTAGKKFTDLKAPTIKPSKGYNVGNPKWKSSFADDSEIKEDRNYVANYDGETEVYYISMDTTMGTVDPDSEKITSEELKGSTATPKSGYEFVGWVKAGDTETIIGKNKQFTPDKKDSAIYIAKFKKSDEKLGKIFIKYVDYDNNPIAEEYKIPGVNYPDYEEGKLGDTVPEHILANAPEFRTYFCNLVINNYPRATYTENGDHTITYKYNKRVSTEKPNNSVDFFEVKFNANGGNFGTDDTDVEKVVYVNKGAPGRKKANVTFAEAREALEEAYGNPSKENEAFMEWQTAATDGEKVAEDYIIPVPKSSKSPIETFYAHYEESGALISYVDLDGKAIDDKFKFLTDEEAKNLDEDGKKKALANKYPTVKLGTDGETIEKTVYTADTAPTFIGYKFNRIELNPANAKYAVNNKPTIKIYYEKLDDIIQDDTPDTDDDKPAGYVTVKFLPGKNGTLEGETKFYVNPKAGKTNADLTEPTIKAKTGFTVADKKWNPEFKADTVITEDAIYTAQYTDGQDVIPVPDPTNPPEKPDGYVTVKFDLDGKGTTTDTVEFYVNPNKEVEITAPTVTGKDGYTPKTGDDAWNPKFVTKAKYDKDTTFLAQYDFKENVVPQGPGEDKPVVPKDYVKVQFKQGKHGTIDQNQTTIYWVNPKVEVDLTEKAPTVKADPEYKHTGWDKPLKATFDKATDITAKYLKKVLDKEPTEDTDKYVKVDFVAETHGNIKAGEKTEYWVLKDETVELKTPEVQPNTNYAFEKWDPAVETSYSEDKTHKAVFKYTGEDVVPQKPGEDKPDVPDNFVQVVFAQGDHGTIADGATTIYWVNPKVKVTITAPTVTANDGYKHVAWTYKLKAEDTINKEETNLQSVTDTFTAEKTTIIAKYLEKVVTKDPQDTTNYVKVSFSAETNGTFADGATTTYWVLKDTPVNITAPTVTANDNYKFIEWKPAVKASYSEDTEHKAQYKKIVVPGGDRPTDEDDKPDYEYVKVTFDPGKYGTIEEEKVFWVLRGEKATLTPPQVTVKEGSGYALKSGDEAWSPKVQTSYTEDTTHVAQYGYNGDDVVPQKPGEDKPDVPKDFVKVEFTKGDHGVISSDETTIYWVNPKAKNVTVTAPKVTADPDWKHTGWKPEVKTAYTEATTHVAQYKEKVVTTNPGDEDYVKVTFKAEANGKLAEGKTETSVWVLKDTEVTVSAPKVTANSGYTFTGWNPVVKTIYSVDTEHKAQYKEKDKVVTEDPNDKDYIKVTFNANGGKIGTADTKDVWVLSGVATFADAKERVATPTKEKATFKEWQDKASEGTKVADTKVLETANEIFYAAYTDDAKIIEDPTTPQPKPGYVRLTLDATEDGKIEGKQTKLIDVLEGTKYNDEDLQNKVKTVIAVYKDNTKVFDKWNPEFPNKAEDVETSKYTATYKVNTKIIDKDPTNPGEVEDGYIRFVFDSNTKDDPAITGKIGKNQKVIFDVIKGTAFNDPDLQEKINGIKPVADDAKLKFNAWDPTVLNDNTLVENATTGMSADGKTITYNATYTDKDKIIDVTPGSEDQDPKEGYVRFTFKANGKDADDAEVTGKVKGQEKYAFDVLKGTPFNDTDLQKKVKDLKAIPDANNYEFEKWNPVVKNDPTLVDADGATKHEYTAVYKKLDKIIDVTDPKVDPKEGYVRLTFDAGDGTFGKDGDKDITQKQIDVLKDTSYTDEDLLAKIKTFEEAAKATDATKKFNAWDPTVPATGLVAEETFTAQYVDKDKITDVEDPKVDPKDGYVRLTFDAKEGKIDGKQTKSIDVLSNLKYSDKDLQAKIAGIKAIPTDTNKVFGKWNPEVPTGDVAVETKTYNATYKDKDKDVIPVPNPDNPPEKPEGYVTVRFLTNKNGTLKGTVTYYVNPTAGKKMSDITPPTITANDGYKVATPNWKPDFTDETPITEDKNFVANYDSFGKAEVNYISMDKNMGKVSPASEKIVDAKDLTGSTATAESGYEFVNWVDVEGKQVSDQAKFIPSKKESATYIAVFKEKTTETTADKVQKLYDFEGVDLAAFVGDTLDNNFWKDGVKYTEKAGSTLTDDEKAAINTALANATVSDLSGRNTKQEVLYPSKGRLEVKFEDNSTIIVEQKLYVYGNGSDKPEDPNQPTPSDEVDVTYVAGDNVVYFDNKVVMVKKGTLEKDLPGKPDAKAQDGFKDLKWTANPEIDAINGIQEATTLIASAGVDHDFAKTSFTVKKVWPEGMTDVPTMNFTLYRTVENGKEEKVQGAEVKTITKDVTEATWDNLAKTDSEGKDYAYSVKETFAEKDAKNDNWILGTMETDGEGNNTITNNLKTVPGEGDKPGDDKNFTGKLTITKILKNEPEQAMSISMMRAPAPAASEQLKFKFKVTGPYDYESEEFELAAGESKTLENLAYGDYKVEETDAKGYTPEYSKAKETLTKDNPNGSITVTNKNVKSTDPQDPNIPSGQVKNVTVTKVWEGGEKPATEIELWRRGYDLNDREFEQKVDSFTTTANGEDTQTHEFKDLAKQDPSGREFTYYAAEPNVPENYTATYSDDNLTVTNKYEAPETPAKEFKVTYVKGADAATGTMNPVTVTENTDYTVLANGYTNDGYTFIGWKLDDGTMVQPGATINVTVDVTLTAQWEKTETPEPVPTEFTIKYISADTNQGTVDPESETVEITGGTINGSTAKANEGYKFVKWMDTDGTTVAETEKFVPTKRESATYIAVFEKEDKVTPQPTNFTIKYISADTKQGTVDPASETVEITGGTIAGSTATPKSGYKFVKWMDTDGNTMTSEGTKLVPTERKDATYIAVFEKEDKVTPTPEPEEPTDFTIKYISADTKQGTVSPASETVAITGGTITGSTATPKEGYKFVKWIDVKGNQVSTDEKFVPTAREDATYIAVFEKEDKVTPTPEPEEPKYFTIKYISIDTDKGIVYPASETLAVSGGRITGSTARAKSGYRFVKWIGTDGLTKSFSANFVPTDRVSATYIAVFEKIESGRPDPWTPRPDPNPRPYEPQDPRPYEPYRPYQPDIKPQVTPRAEEREIDVFSLYMIGNEDKLFMPYKGITRAEVAQIFARALRYDGYMRKGEYNPYPDVSANAWYYDAVVTTTEAGVFKGTDRGTFEPNREITKAELISTIGRFQKLVNKDGNSLNMRADHWARPEVEAAYQEGWLDVYTNGTVAFDADMVISRAEVARILNRAFGRIADVEYINSNIGSLVTFADVKSDDWFYYDALTAANTYASYGMKWINHSDGMDNEFTSVEAIRWIKPLIHNDKLIEIPVRVKFQRIVR